MGPAVEESPSTSWKVPSLSSELLRLMRALLWPPFQLQYRTQASVVSVVTSFSAEVEGGKIEVAAFGTLAGITIDGHRPILQDMAIASYVLDELVVLLLRPRKMASEVYQQLIPLLRTAVQGVHQRPGIALGSHVKAG